MKDWNSIAIATIGVLAFLLLGCSSNISPTTATLEGNTYSNHLFKFKIQIPNGWSLNDKNVYRRAVASYPVAEDSEGHQSGSSSQEEEEEEDKVSNQLLFLTELPYGTPAESNDSIVMRAVNLASEPSIRTAKDYQELLIRSMADDKSRRQLGEPFSTKLGDREFRRVDFEIKLLSQTVYQAFFITVEKRYALLVVVTADSKAEVSKILRIAGYPQAEQ